MNHRERMALDEHIAGGHHSKAEVEVVCNNNNCGWEGYAFIHTEYGCSDMIPESCPDCKRPLDAKEGQP